MSIEDNASIALIPSGYKSGKLYSVIPDSGNGDFTHSRGSTATRVAASGLIETVASGVPRLDYPLIDGVVQDCPALLLEPSRTNYVTNSEDLTGGSKSVVTATANTTETTDPSGGNNATKFQVTASGSDAYSRTQYTAALTNFSSSVYVKASEGQKFQIFLARDSYSQIVNGDLITCTGDWQRVEFSGTFNTTSSTVVLGIEFGHSATDSVSGQVYYCWGAQLEAGSYPTSYVKTSGSTATRSADVCNGSGTSAEFNDSEGVLFVESAALANDGTSRVIASISNGSITTNRVVLQYTNASGGNEVVAFAQATSYSSVLTRSIADALTFNKFAVVYNDSTNNFDSWVNGTKIGDGTFNYSFTSNSLSKIQFADGNSTSNPFYGKTKQLMTFKTALNDSELETLTSWDSFNAMATGQLYTIE